jgi:nucleoside-diphosphate-sugar epimerase
MNVLVTGATGFIGHHLVERLLEAGCRVKALVRGDSKNSSALDARIDLTHGDVRTADAVQRAAEGCAVIYHLAAKTSHGGASPEETYSTNVEGTKIVAEAALRAGVKRLVLASTTGVYGPVSNRSIDARTPVKPYSPYTRSKVEAEKLLLSRHSSQGLGVVVARITSVFGRGHRGWLGLFRAIRAGEFRFIGSGENYRHPGDIADIVEGLVLCGTAANVEGRTYNLAGNEPLPLRTMIALICEELQAPALRSPWPELPLHAYRLLNSVFRACGGEQLPRFDRVRFFLTDETFDQSRERSELGHRPCVTMREAVHRQAQWYREEGWLPV